MCIHVRERVAYLLGGSEGGDKFLDHGEDVREAVLAQAVRQPAAKHAMQRVGEHGQWHGAAQEGATIPHLTLIALVLYEGRTFFPAQFSNTRRQEGREKESRERVSFVAILPPWVPFAH